MVSSKNRRAWRRRTPAVHRLFCLQFSKPMTAIATQGKGMMGIDEDEELEYHVTAVTADGLNGLVTSEILYNGEPLSFGDSEGLDSEQWVFIDGE